MKKANEISSSSSTTNQTIKRGQKGKMKKMKMKYKDQDEEERQLRMKILQSAGQIEKQKDDSKSSKITTNELNDDGDINNQEKQSKFNKTSSSHQQEPDDIDDNLINTDVDMLDSLTGCPVDEDEILFAVPVVAPYQALQNYKYVCVNIEYFECIV